MYTTPPISLLDFVISISNAIGHIDVRIAHHHKRVAYIASQIAQEMGAPQRKQYDIVIAGLLHDIGVLTGCVDDFRQQYEGSVDNVRHSEAGYQLLKKFGHFIDVATIIRSQHVEYVDHASGAAIPNESMVLHLANFVDALIDNGQPILDQVDHIVSVIARDAGHRFKPEYVDAFLELAWRESFWLDVVLPNLEQVLLSNCRNYSVELDNDDLLDFAELLAYVIDFRSHFTATHSSGVAMVAAVLANLIGFSETECQKVRVAGYLHDIGKLAIPVEILEKIGKLTSEEYRTIKSHVYYTNRILEPLRGMDDIRVWASMHHERLDGNGYPGRCSAHTIPLGARIIAAADVFTALLESRAYRTTLSKPEVVQMLQGMVQRNLLDGKVVEVLLSNFDTIDLYRVHAQGTARAEYQAFRDSVEQSIASVPNEAAQRCATTCSYDVQRKQMAY